MDYFAAFRHAVTFSEELTPVYAYVDGAFYFNVLNVKISKKRSRKP